MSTYRKKLAAAGITAAAGTLLGALTLLSPSTVRAFWPFSSAQAADDAQPVLHDPSLRLLAAAINPDPNPSKGDGGLQLSEGSALMATVGPDGTPASEKAVVATAASSEGEISVYTVEEGDSISGIADHFGVSVNTILWANDLTVHSTIRPGMDLVILPVSGVQHKVAKGETLSTIAAKYDASAEEIATFNGLDTRATVVVGSTLIIPHGEVTTSASAKAVKKASSKSVAPASKTVKTGSDLAAASGSGYFQNPVPGAILTQGIHGNNGVDLGAPSGTPIHAAAAGTVLISKNDGAWNGGYGSYVVIKHANGTQTLYAHMSKDIASVGASVAKGEVIGYVGETGEATGNHLHFEVRGGKNPIGYSCSVMSRCY